MSLNLPLFALAAGAFGIGTTEFAPMGLLPVIAADLHVSIPTAGLLVTGYALGVVVGAPLLTLPTERVPRKWLLLGLMALFTIGNLLSALSPNYAVLLAARVVTSLCHGAFFGVGSVVAESLVAPAQHASAVRRDVHGADDRQHRWCPVRHLGRPASWLACGICRHRRAWCDRDPGDTACFAETRGGAAVERGAGTRRHATSCGATRAGHDRARVGGDVYRVHLHCPNSPD